MRHLAVVLVSDPVTRFIEVGTVTHNDPFAVRIIACCRRQVASVSTGIRLDSRLWSSVRQPDLVTVDDGSRVVVEGIGTCFIRV